MNSTRASLLPAGFFQAIAILFFIMCVYSLFIKFDAIPSISTTFTDDYGQTISFYNVSYISVFFQSSVVLFWIIFAIKAFRKKCYLGVIGSLLEILLCAYFAMTQYALVKAITSPATDYDSIISLNHTLSLPFLLTTSIEIIAIIMIAVKGNIPTWLKIVFILYPIMAGVAFGILFGQNWYIWFQIIYATALVILSLKSNNKNQFS